MSEILLTLKSLKKASCVATLMLVASVSYQSRTLAQTPLPSAPNIQFACLAGYPDGTYRGNRPVTRNEFAAGLNACLNQVEQLLRTNTASAATRKDFEALIQRQTELNEQLRELNGRVSSPPASNSPQPSGL